MTIQELIKQGYHRMYTPHTEQAVSLFATIDQTGLYVWDMDDRGDSPFALEAYYLPDAAQDLTATHGFAPDWTPVGTPEGGQP